MKRLTTDNPQTNVETMMNMVYGKDGWQYIRCGDEEVSTIDFCMTLCKNEGCDIPESVTSDNEKSDHWLCNCGFSECPIAAVYAALCGFGHVRNRLKMYEDAGIAPPGHTLDNKALGEV